MLMIQAEGVDPFQFHGQGELNHRDAVHSAGIGNIADALGETAADARDTKAALGNRTAHFLIE